jgi:hypothetical protein
MEPTFLPFTAAHPATVLPLVRPLGRFAVPSALVIGSVVPDLSYFLPWPQLKSQSHTLIGLFTFCLPAGLISYGAFHVFIAPLVFDLAPTTLRSRLPLSLGTGRLPSCSLGSLLISLVVGAATHIIWDSFTHESGLAVQTLPILATPVVSWQGYTVFVFKIFQHGSTLLGLGALTWWGLKWLNETGRHQAVKSNSPSTRIVLVILLVAPAAVFGTAAALTNLHHGEGWLRQLQVFIGTAVFSGGTVLLISTLIVAGAWRMLRRKPGQRVAPPHLQERHLD